MTILILFGHSIDSQPIYTFWVVNNLKFKTKFKFLIKNVSSDVRTFFSLSSQLYLSNNLLTLGKAKISFRRFLSPKFFLPTLYCH